VNTLNSKKFIETLASLTCVYVLAPAEPDRSFVYRKSWRLRSRSLSFVKLKDNTS